MTAGAANEGQNHRGNQAPDVPELDALALMLYPPTPIGREDVCLRAAGDLLVDLLILLRRRGR
jgi:hypothetical protein